MEILKLTSIRLSKSALSQADKLGRSLGYYHTSDILRVAIWLGLKFLAPGVLHKFMSMMWEEENKDVYYSLEDVLRAAGEI